MPPCYIAGAYIQDSAASMAGARFTHNPVPTGWLGHYKLIISVRTDTNTVLSSIPASKSKHKQMVDLINIVQF